MDDTSSFSECVCDFCGKEYYLKNPTHPIVKFMNPDGTYKAHLPITPRFCNECYKSMTRLIKREKDIWNKL